jgi:integrase
MGSFPVRGCESGSGRSVAQRSAFRSEHQGQNQKRNECAVSARDALRMGDIKSHSIGATERKAPARAGCAHASRVIALLAELQEPCRTLVLVASTTGLRRGELFGLKWEDVDFKRGELRIMRSIVDQIEGAEITKVIGWHTFRRTLATLLQSLGASVKTTQELMRHSSPVMTLGTYAQAVTSDKREAQSNVAALFVVKSTGKKRRAA